MPWPRLMPVDEKTRLMAYGRIFKKVLLPALISGLLLTVAFPKTGLSWLAWVALVPLLFSLADLSPKACFAAGFFAGWIHFLTLGYWLITTIMTYGGVPLLPALLFYLGLAACLAVYFGLFGLLLSWLRAGPTAVMAAVPFIWVGLEFLRAHLFTGLPWGLLGYSQFERLDLIQIADIAGVYGISFVIVLINAAVTCLLLWLTKRPWREMPVKKGTVIVMATAVLFCLGASCGYGRWRLGNIADALSTAPTRTIAVIQGNINQGQKWDRAFRLAVINKHLAMARRTVDRDPDLIVMPETAMPFYFFYEQDLTDMVLAAARDTGTFILTGAPAFEIIPGGILSYNSAFLINPAGNVLGRYDKTHLVPFGEYVPFGQYLPFIDKLVTGVGDFTPGTSERILPMNGCRLGVQICYEIIFPAICRKMVENGAEIIINITNDAWYGRTSAPYQHFSMTVLRAVENRRSLVRAANTGISGFIDPTGRIRAETGLFVDSTPVYRVPVIKERTFYNRTGDLLAICCLLVVLFVPARKIHEIIRQKEKNRPAREKHKRSRQK